MSSLAGLLLLALCLTTPLVAQGAKAWRDSTARLEHEVRSLRDSMIHGDSTVREVAHRGDLVLGATLDQRDRAGPALEYFMAARSRWFSGAAPSRDGFRIALRIIGGRSFSGRYWARGEQAGGLVLAGLPDTGGAVRTVRTVWRDDPGRTLVDAFGEMMLANAEASVQRWMRRPPPLYLADHERRELVMYAVVTGTGTAQRGCVTGRVADCAYALGLRDPAGGEPGLPYDPMVRSDLLLVALEAGGAGAWARLNQPVGSDIETALAAAAAIPGDSLIVLWRRSVLALQPETAPLEAGQVLVLLGWSTILLLGTLGIPRWA